LIIFTDEQLAVINHKKGHALVSAVAGSGKTSTLKARIEFLLQNNIEPNRILVLMYNRDIKDDFQNYYNSRNTPSPRIETFHSLGKSILEKHDQLNSGQKKKLVTDNYLQQDMLKQAHAEFRPEQSIDEFKQVTEAITLWKVNGDSPQDVDNNLQYDDIDIWIKSAYHSYERLRKESKIRFLEDLIYDTLSIIKNEISFISNHFDSILVDEYQDINRSQQSLLRALAGSRASVMVVGDPDQCVYEWRGSRPDFIVGLFEKEFGSVQRYHLGKTFRFGHRVSLLANSCIRHNTNRFKAICLSAKGTPLTEIYHCMSDNSPYTVLSIIKENSSNGIPLSEVCLLARAYGHAVGIELMLLKEGIAYNTGAQKTLRDREGIQVLACFLSLALCGGFQSIAISHRQASFRTLLRLSKLYFTKKELNACAKVALGNNTWDIELRLIASKVLNSKKLQSLDNKIKLWKSLICGTEITNNAYKTLMNIQGLCQIEDLWEDTYSNQKDANDKKRSFQVLIECIQQMDATTEELVNLIFKSPESYSNEEVTITSIHKAKGLEWPVVIVLELNEGEFPMGIDPVQSTPELEEERRLFYVAITRAKEKLYLISSIDDNLIRWRLNDWYGVPKNKSPVASRFLYESEFKKSNEVGTLLDNNQAEKVKFSAKDYLIKKYLKLL